MFQIIKHILSFVIILFVYLIYGYEQQILKEDNLDKLVLLLNKNNLKKQDIYLIISKLEHCGETNPDAYFLLGTLYQQNKLSSPGMLILTEAERTKRATQYYLKASHKSIEANLKLADIFINNKEQHLSYTLKAATLGSLDAKQKIATAFHSGYRFANASLNKTVLNLLESPSSNNKNCSAAIQKPITLEITQSSSNELNSNSSTQNDLSSLKVEHKKKTIVASPIVRKPGIKKIKSNNIINIVFIRFLIIRFTLLGCVGLLFALCQKVYLFYNLADSVMSSVISFILFLLFSGLFDSNSNNEDFVLYSIIAMILVGTLIPYSILANQSSWWSFIIVVPAKTMISCLGIFALLGCAGKTLEVLKSNNDRGKNLVSAAIFGALAYWIHQMIMKTTKNK